MATTTPQTTSSSTTIDHLSALPVELSLKISVQLTTKEICRLRVVNRRHYTLIEENKQSTLTLKIEEQLARIRLDHGLVCTPNANLYKAIQGLLDYTGFVEDFNTRSHLSTHFFRIYWQQHWAYVPINTATLVHSPVLLLIEFLISGGTSAPTHGLSIDKLVHLFAQGCYNVGRPEWAENAENLLIIAPSCSRRCIRESISVGKQPVTSSQQPQQQQWQPTPLPEIMSPALELPPIAGEAERFLYHIRSVSTSQMAEQALTDRAGALTLFEKAGLLEEVYLW